MERGKKHHNLRHVLPLAEQAAALAKVGGGPAATLADAGERILAAKQKELHQLFAAVYGCPTSSFNNEWLRRKLLTAVGLPPNWRPPPELAPELPPCRPEECSRYGRRRRRVASYALPGSSEEEESNSDREQSRAPRAIRRRISSASLASARREGSADSAGAGTHPVPNPAAPPVANGAGWRNDGPACSGAGTSPAGSAGSAGSTPAAIFAMQARAAAAFASQPTAPVAPSIMVPVDSAPRQPLSTVVLPAGQPSSASSPATLPSLVPAAPAAPAAQRAALGWGLDRRVAVAPTQVVQAPTLPSLATFLTNPGQVAAAPTPAPLAEQLVQPPSAPDSLSQQLHTLFEDWEAGHVSLLSFNPL